jgi:signal transduction histidine kinase/ActR/RegA family two-component response regulator
MVTKIHSEAEALGLARKGRSGLGLLRLGRLAMAILLVMTAGSVAFFFLIRSVVADQEARILHEHAGELALLLDESVQSDTTLLPLVGTTSNAKLPKAFAQVTALLDDAGKASVNVFTVHGSQLRSVNHAGKAALGTETVAKGAALIERAATTKGLVGGIIGSGQSRALVLADGSTSGVVVVETSALGAVTAAPAPAGSPFSDVNLALYASTQASHNSLLVISGAAPTGPVDSQFLTIGSDRWLLLTSAKQPLVGTIAADAPWVSLLAGLIATLLVATLIEGLARRRSYALALVEERTATLEAALAERSRLQLAEQVAREEAESANRYKNTFISRMSHELRTPLNAVIGFGQLLERQQLSDDQRDSVDHILKGGHHLLDLINEVLDIARIESGDLGLSSEPVLVSTLVGDALSLVRPLAAQYSINLIGGRDSACAEYVFADRQRLQQILLNLLSNGVKYNRVGGTVAVSCEPRDATHLRIKVADTGYGISPEQLGHLFTPFERLGAERSEIEGTGIGLALSRQLAEAMGGTLDIESTVGQGSTFWVELPLVEAPIERLERLHILSTHEESHVGSAPGERRTVLYIEDNLANLTLIQRIVAERDGIEIIPAMQGRLGLELAREHQPAVVLLDLHLPDISGDEVLQRLRDDPATSQIPVVMVSADATPGQIQRLLNAGALAYLTKPIDVGQLLQLLDDHVLAKATANAVGERPSAEVRA